MPGAGRSKCAALARQAPGASDHQSRTSGCIVSNFSAQTKRPAILRCKPLMCVEFLVGSASFELVNPAATLPDTKVQIRIHALSPLLIFFGTQLSGGGHS